jgi:signal transduction histidine kinase
MIVEQHGGSVGLESTPSAGATFWFTLPLASLPPNVVS